MTLIEFAKSIKMTAKHAAFQVEQGNIVVSKKGVVNTETSLKRLRKFQISGRGRRPAWIKEIANAA